jgi:hypothetical protein
MAWRLFSCEDSSDKLLWWLDFLLLSVQHKQTKEWNSAFV